MLKVERNYTITLSETEADDLKYFCQWADIDMSNPKEIRDYVDSVENIYHKLLEVLPVATKD